MITKKGVVPKHYVKILPKDFDDLLVGTVLYLVLETEYTTRKTFKEKSDEKLYFKGGYPTTISKIKEVYIVPQLKVYIGGALDNGNIEKYIRFACQQWDMQIMEYYEEATEQYHYSNFIKKIINEFEKTNIYPEAYTNWINEMKYWLACEENQN